MCVVFLVCVVVVFMLVVCFLGGFGFGSLLNLSLSDMMGVIFVGKVVNGIGNIVVVIG